MGLKYNLFMVKMPIEEFAKRLQKNAKFIDETELMKKYEEFERQIWEEAKKAQRTDPLFKEPEDERLREYAERIQKDKIVGMSVWFRTLPTDERFIFGGYTNVGYPFLSIFKTVLSSLFIDAGIKEWIFIDYHHGNDSGDIQLVKLNNNSLEVKKFNQHKKDNCHETFETFAKRIQDMVNYPILSLHNYLYNEIEIKWQYHMTRLGKFDRMVKKKFLK